MLKISYAYVHDTSPPTSAPKTDTEPTTTTKYKFRVSRCPGYVRIRAQPIDNTQTQAYPNTYMQDM